MSIAVVLGALGGPSYTATCNGNGWHGTCAAATNSGTQVDVSGTRSGTGATSGGQSRGGQTTPKPRPTTAASAACADSSLCRGTYAMGLIPHPTLADLASFRPAAPQLLSEPNGMGVVGLPVNLVGAAETQRMPGRLFDLDVTVRFTPTAYRFEYGDGATSTTSTGGRSWSSLRVPQFTPTDTGHTYEMTGTFRAAVTVMYAAAVDFGNGWIPVDGLVSARGGATDVRIFRARTALVAHTCIEVPTGPGC
jgi:hypothetical protein